MDDNEEGSQDNAKEKPSIFVVRLGQGHEADYAVCKQIGLIRGATKVPGTGRTVSEMADEQALKSAKLLAEERKGLRKLMFMAASGQNEDDLDND